MDFTQPYIDSGLVVVAPVQKLKSSAWAFLRPFTPLMWGVTAAFFLIVGAVVWILEHRMNDEFRGPPKRQFITILWCVKAIVVFYLVSGCNTAEALFQGNKYISLCALTPFRHVKIIILNSIYPIFLSICASTLSMEVCGASNLILAFSLRCRFGFSTMFFAHSKYPSCRLMARLAGLLLLLLLLLK